MNNNDKKRLASISNKISAFLCSVSDNNNAYPLGFLSTLESAQTEIEIFIEKEKR